MVSFAAGLLLLLALAETQTQPAPARSAFAMAWDEMLHRAANGHSPTPDEITAAGTPTLQLDADAVLQALPQIRKALTDPDATVRTYALTALIGLEITPPTSDPLPAPDSSAPATSPAVPDATVTTPAPSALPQTMPAGYKPAVAAVLLPALPDIGKDLADENAPNRILAAGALAGFGPNAPAAVYPPLLAYLRRDDGIGPAGLAVVDDLLQIGPISDATASALVRYLHRNDQTADTRSSLIDLFAAHPNQSQQVNQALLSYLDTDEPSVRARLILSLPQLDLANSVFTDMRSRISILAANDQENLQVVHAAKAVSACWTAPRMPAGCPVY